MATNGIQPDNPSAKALSESQRPRISDEDCEILSVFRNADELVLAFRNLLFGFELNEKEQEMIGRLQNEPVKKVIRKMLLPELQKDIPVGQNMDLWMTQDISNCDEETFDLAWRIKELLIEMVETSLTRLDDLDKDGVDLTPKKDLASLKARIGYVNHTTAVIYDMIMNAHRSKESADELMKRIKANSNK